MELVQFHPTGMVWPEEVAGTLVTEAVRGEGGHLLNADGERFMTHYDPRRMELSARDLVAMANYSEIVAGRAGPHGGVLLDVTHLPKDVILEKLPRMYRQFMEWQLLDISREPMEVAPTAHYSMGGVVVDPESQATEVDGLFAAGEVTGGLHGANRLGGNSLTETIVFGRRAGEHAARRSLDMDSQLRPRRAIAAAQDELDAALKHGPELARPLQRALRNAMWQGCGVVREAAGLKGTLDRIDQLTEASAHVDVRPSSEGYLDLAVALDLRASLLAAEATVRGAFERRESRGAHQRSDHPAVDPAMRVTLRSRLQDLDRAGGARGAGRLETTAVVLPPVPPSFGELLTAPRELSAAGRLLE
jgi:succinate dehydrogenase / fumarate reductase flavoprotein subunit